MGVPKHVYANLATLRYFPEMRTNSVSKRHVRYELAKRRGLEGEGVSQQRKIIDGTKRLATNGSSAVPDPR